MTTLEEIFGGLLDHFTRIDDLLRSIKNLLEEINAKLDRITTAGAITYPTITPSPPTEAVPAAPSVTIPLISANGLTLIPVANAPVDIVGIKKYEVSSDQDTKHELSSTTNLIYLYVTDNDVYFNKVETDTAQPFLIPKSSGLVIARSSKIDKLYFRAVTGTATVYIMELKYSR